MLALAGAFNFKNIVRILSLVAVIGLGVVGYFGVRNYLDLRDLAEERGRQVEVLYQSIETYKIELTRIETNLKVAEETRALAEAAAEQYRALQNRINNTKETDNGTLAPVLRDTLDALRGLQ